MTENSENESSTSGIEENVEQDSMIEPDDPCNSYQWSIVFLLILIMATVLVIFQCFVMYRRRQDLFSAFDIGQVSHLRFGCILY